MVLREAVGSIGNSNYWGLVQQKGPWKSVARDHANAKSSLHNKFFRGGGVQGGGTKNAGNGGWYSQMNPDQQYRMRGPPPRPTRYAQRKVTFTKDEFGHHQRIGKPRVGASFPTSGGQFPGTKPRTEQVFQGGVSKKVADEVTSNVLAPINTDIDNIADVDASMGIITPTSPAAEYLLGVKRRGSNLENPKTKIREPKIDQEIKTRLTSMVENKIKRDEEESKQRSLKNLATRIKKNFNPALPADRYK